MPILPVLYVDYCGTYDACFTKINCINYSFIIVAQCYGQDALIHNDID